LQLEKQLNLEKSPYKKLQKAAPDPTEEILKLSKILTSEKNE
jgi:hypothetical protein